MVYLRNTSLPQQASCHCCGGGGEGEKERTREGKKKGGVGSDREAQEEEEEEEKRVAAPGGKGPRSGTEATEREGRQGRLAAALWLSRLLTVWTRTWPARGCIQGKEPEVEERGGGYVHRLTEPVLEWLRRKEPRGSGCRDRSEGE